MEYKSQKKPRVLCLHGFRTSGEILRKSVSRWPQAVLDELDLVFLDGPFPATGKSMVEGKFDPPYYEWFQSSKGFTVYENFETSVAYVEDYMMKHGPFDGLLGFSQGGNLAAAIPGMQSEGVAFTKVPKIKFVMLISTGVFGRDKSKMPKLAANAFNSLFKIPSLHITGERDFMKKGALELSTLFLDPILIFHPNGHSVPKLDEKGAAAMLEFIHKVKSTPRVGSSRMSIDVEYYSKL